MSDTLLNLHLDQIDQRSLPLRQRLGSNELEELKRSIQRYGVIEPVVVAQSESGYKLVVGRRRFEACRLLGLETIPAIVRKMSDERGRELSYQSNLQSEMLNLADEVEFLRGIDIFHLPDEEIASRFGMSPEEVSVAKRFNRLPPPLREAVRTGEIDERRALALTRLLGEVEQTRFFRYIQKKNPPLEILEKKIDEAQDGTAAHI